MRAMLQSLKESERAKFRRTKGAMKLHLLLDHDGYLPPFAVVTEGKTSEIKVARTLRLAPGTILAIGRSPCRSSMACSTRSGGKSRSRRNRLGRRRRADARVAPWALK